VVDPAGTNANDEIFLIEMMSEHPGPNARETLATINGKSWPHTQRFQYHVGEVVRWRWINATEPHALHLKLRVDAVAELQIVDFRRTPIEVQPWHCGFERDLLHHSGRNTHDRVAAAGNSQAMHSDWHGKSVVQC
jgi:hypothetical protein